jgi:hypothetical protein
LSGCIRIITVVADRCPVEKPQRSAMHAGACGIGRARRRFQALLECRVEILIEEISRLHDAHLAIDQSVAVFPVLLLGLACTSRAMWHRSSALIGPRSSVSPRCLWACSPAEGRTFVKISTSNKLVEPGGDTRKWPEPKFRPSLNREASRLGDVRVRRPSFRAQVPETYISTRCRQKLCAPRRMTQHEPFCARSPPRISSGSSAKTATLLENALSGFLFNSVELS